MEVYTCLFDVFFLVVTGSEKNRKRMLTGTISLSKNCAIKFHGSVLNYNKNICECVK